MRFPSPYAESDTGAIADALGIPSRITIAAANGGAHRGCNGAPHWPVGAVEVTGAGAGEIRHAFEAEVAQPPASPIGHNSASKPSIRDHADEVLRAGRLITSFRRIGLALRDRRCERAHLIVLFAIMELINHKTGTSFPSRRAIAEQEGLNERAVENAVYELRKWGYIDWEKRAQPDLHKGRLLHYTLPVLTWTEDELTKAILAHREALRDRSTPPTVYTAHGAHRPQSTPPTVLKSTPPAVTRNLLREPAKNSRTGADVRASPTRLLDDREQELLPKARRAPKATEEQFARFWAVYPIREGKAAARKNFMALSHGEAEQAIVGAAGYAAKIAAERVRLAKRGEEPRIKYAQGWLTDRRFEDYAPSNEAHHIDAGVDDEVQRLANTETGRAMIGDMGRERALQAIRADVISRRGGANE